MTSPNPQKLAKWLKIEDTVKHEFYQMLSSRRIYNQYKEIVEKNDAINQEGIRFHNWVTTNYVTYIQMAIRRQADTDDDVRALGKLITEIKDNPSEISRDWHTGLWAIKDGTLTDTMKGVADATFSKYAGTGTHFDTAIGETDLARLKAVSANITKLADRTVAHSSKQPIPKVTFEEVDTCIEGFKELLQKYSLLLTAADNLLEPMPLNDWQGIFAKIWIRQ